MLAVLLGWLAAGASWAGGPGTAGAEFLSIHAAPIPASLGGAFAAHGEPDSISYNPAGIAFVERPSLSAAHSEHFVGTRQEYLAFVLPLKAFGTLGLVGSFMYSGDIDAFDENDTPAGSVSTQHGFGALAYARSFSFFQPRLRGEAARRSARLRWALGFAPKYVYEKLAGTRATAVGGDAGTLVELFGRLRLGASVTNVGAKQKFVNESFPLPTTLRAGASFTLSDPEKKKALALTVSADAVEPKDGPGYRAYGARVQLFPWLELRGGYRTRQESGDGYSAGLGINLDKMVIWELFRGIRLDYAYLPSGRLQTAHRMGLQLRW